jgi:signal transduction histidine kinase
MQAGVALHVGERRPEQVRDSLTAIRDASKEGLAELRALVDLLRDENGLAPRAPTATLDSLDELVERTRGTGLSVTVRVEGRRRPLPTAVELAAFRIVQEAVTNVVRHAGAGQVEISLGYGDSELDIQVDDDGRGGTVDPDSVGSGITGMRERVSALDGSIRLDRSHLGGFRVAASLPVRDEA